VNREKKKEQKAAKEAKNSNPFPSVGKDFVIFASFY